MASCSACGSTIIFGGTRIGSARFCNESCAKSANLLSAAHQVSDADALMFASKIHGGKCPKCSGPGPVDVRTSHQVWSALIMTQWRSSQHVACRKCGIKAQAGDLAISALAGWWGFPWGVLVTPVQIVRNILGMAVAPNPSRPSSQLIQRARLLLAQRSLSAD